MKKLTYLFLALIIFACSDDEGSNGGCPINFDDNDIICLNVSCSDCSYIIYGGCD